ncbi:MAG TPA: L,D-transpeptidase [Acidimicrobiales bacterium]
MGAVFAVALLLGACGGGGGDDEEADGDAPTETTEPAVPEGTSYYAEATIAEVPIYDSEDATEPTQSLANPTERGVPLVFLVDGLETDGERIPVHLPVKPNGSKGWVDAADVKLTANPYSIEVRLAEHNLKVKKGTEVIIDTSVGLGAAGAETPVGTYFIKELLQNPNPDDVYGPYAYGISAFTENPEVADQFGGDGVIGVHGTNDPSSIGQNVSHGCIRLPNDVITEMANMLPLGTPIEILA